MKRIGIVIFAAVSSFAGNTTVSVEGESILLNGEQVKLVGLRSSNALINDQATDNLIRSLKLYRVYGMNAISVFVMGSRFGDVKGYLPDASLNPVYAERLERILRATDERGMVTIIGCLYWGTSRAKEELGRWSQTDAERAVSNTARWLGERGFRHVILDPDNEGMAGQAMKWKAEALICAAKAANPELVIANNTRQKTVSEDLNMHFGPKKRGKPWLDSESTPDKTPYEYWGRFSKETHEADAGFYNYSRIGRYTEEMKKSQIKQTQKLIEKYNGILLASTWLQCAPGEKVGGPFSKLGGYSNLGSGKDKEAAWNQNIDTLHRGAGIRWWAEFVEQFLR